MRKVKFVCICYVLLLFTLSMGACAFIRSQSASGLTLREWVDLQVFTPFILWPESEGSSLLFPPRYIEGQGYVELVYSEDFIGSGVEPSMYTLYESDSDWRIGKSFLADYATAKPQVTASTARLNVCGRSVSAQIRENTRIPDSGVAVFELEETHIVFYWRNKSRAAAFDVLKHNLVQVDKDNPEIILSFDQMLEDEFQTPDPSSAFGFQPWLSVPVHGHCF